MPDPHTTANDADAGLSPTGPDPAAAVTTHGGPHGSPHTKPHAEPRAAPGHRLPLRLLLAFTPASFERRFVQHHVAVYHRYAQASLILGMLLVFGDFLVDHFAYPAVSANLLRLQLALPILAVGLGYTFLPGARRHWQPVLAGFIAALALALFGILLAIDAQGGAGLRSWVGILNFTFLQFYCFVILGVQFRIALISGGVILAAFEGAMLWHPAPLTSPVSYWSYHVVTLFILAAGIGWWREFLLRTEFSIRTELDDARRAAVELAQTKSQFLAAMSHEIRTPMNGVLGLNELLVNSELLPQQRAWAEAMQAAGRHLLAVVNDVLDVSRIEAGQVRLEAVDFELVDVIEDALALFAQPAQAKGLDLLGPIVPPQATLRVQGDPLRLRQVLVNLVGNAVKFTERGEVSVTVEVVDHAADAVQLHIDVQDTGIGIDAAAHEAIFEPFSQADSSTTRRFGGTGLGLPICRQLTALMGGHIRVDSKPGKGTRFRIALRLPLARPGAEAAPDLQALDGARVLVADAHGVRCNQLRQQLLAWRADSDCVGDGARALPAVARAARSGRPFDVVLLDAQLAAATGPSLVEAIRRQAAPTVVRVIEMGMARQAGDARLRSAPGTDAQIAKPVRRAELQRALVQAMTPTSASAPTPISTPTPTDLQALTTAMAPTLPVARVPLPADTAPLRHGPAQAVSALRGRVLLVEDNTINQRVATGMLDKLGLQWQIAENGAVAVNLVREQDFDLVLMDGQMPVMDGFQATVAIRRLPDGRGARLPIVALTANTVVGEAERCLAAGMNAYVAKPFSLPALHAVLSRWLAVRTAPQRADGPSSPPQKADGQRREAPAATGVSTLDRVVESALRGR
jgi:signal transduction histidine kinase/CheY-like chemotaxis protein